MHALNIFNWFLKLRLGTGWVMEPYQGDSSKTLVTYVANVSNNNNIILLAGTIVTSHLPLCACILVWFERIASLHDEPGAKETPPRTVLHKNTSDWSTSCYEQVTGSSWTKWWRGKQWCRSQDKGLFKNSVTIHVQSCSYIDFSDFIHHHHNNIITIIKF